LPWVLPLLLVLAGFALSEFYALLDASRIPHFKVVGLLCGLAMMTGTWFALRSGAAWSQEVEGFVLFAATAVIFLRQIGCRHVDRPWDTMAGTLLGLIYVVFLFNFSSNCWWLGGRAPTVGLSCCTWFWWSS
jgi:hypothetical protein